jgi:hypothetical protein
MQNSFRDPATKVGQVLWKELSAVSGEVLQELVLHLVTFRDHSEKGGNQMIPPVPSSLATPRDWTIL